jgi:HlyD family secretion protein/adhesin transport system membrane fusion protein
MSVENEPVHPTHLAEEPYLDDGMLRRTLNGIAGAIVLVLAAALLWSVLTPVDEVARAPGLIAPKGQVQIVDALDGGLITEIMVSEGSKVEKGEPLLRFDQVRSRSQLDVALARKAALEIGMERLTAFIEDRAPAFDAYKDYPGLVARETAALSAQRLALEADLDLINQQLVAKRAQLGAIEKQIPAYRDEVEAVDHAFSIVQGLSTQGLASQFKLAELIEQKARTERGMAEAVGQHTVTQGQVAEQILAISSRTKKAQAEAAQKRAELGAEYRSVVEQLPGLRDKVESSTVVAPVAGVVQSLAKPRVGQVVNAGDVVAEIVPSHEGLLFEAHLSPRDIGFVARGQTVKVKIDAYDFSRYGALPGIVESISATTLADQHGALYYRLRVHLDKTSFRDDENLQVQAGMTGEADIRTGTKTVFQYLLKPIYANLDLALTER